MKRADRVFLLPLLLLIVLAGTFVAGRLSLPTDPEAWPGVSAEWRASVESAVRESFAGFQDAGIASLTRAAAALTSADDSAQARDSLFEILRRAAGPGTTLELYETSSDTSPDSSARLVAWSGPEGPGITASDLSPSHGSASRSFIDRGPIESHLVIIYPLVRGGRPSAHLAAWRLFDLHHPVSRRPAGKDDAGVPFTETASRASGASLEFIIPPRAQTRGPALSEGRAVSDGGLIIPLMGIGGRAVGYARAEEPDRTAWLAGLRASNERRESILLVAVLASLVLAAGWRYRGRLRRPAYAVALIAALWIVRYTMLRAGIPGSFGPADLFDPSLFASSFGHGAAGSPGDMLISAVFLALSVCIAAVTVPAAVSGAPAGERKGSGVAAAALGAAALLGLLGVLTRAFHALVRSVVFDSRVDLNDPLATYPDLPAAALLLGAMLLAFSIFAAGALIIGGARRLVSGILPGHAGAASAVVIAGAVLSSILFDLLHPNPLGGWLTRLLLIGAFGAVAWLDRRGARSGAGTPVMLLAAFLVSAAALIPALDASVHEHEKRLIEAAVRDMARPEDAWMNNLLNASLDSMSDTATASVLRSGDARATGKLAYTRWAGSVLAAEGNTCSVTFVDGEGTVVSHFHLGPAPHWSRQIPMDGMPRSTRISFVESRSLRGRLSPWYRGYAPLFSADGSFAGGVWLGIAPEDPAGILGRGTDLLMVEDADARPAPRTLIVAEYSEGRLISSSAETLPYGRSLPAAAVPAALPPEGIWLDEEIGALGYETYYAAGSARSVIAVSLESLDAEWHFYSYSRYALVFGSVFFVCWGLYALSRAAGRAIRGERRAASFRTRLAAAFAIVSVVPVVIIAYYNRESLQAEAERSTDAFLKSQTELVLNEIEGRMGMTVPYEMTQFSDETIEEIAAVLNTHAHLYAGAYVAASSRPDLLAAELVDRRIPAEAYTAMYLEGANFHAQEQSIGQVTYLVGYRPVRSQSGEAIGAVAVPALSRQGEIAADLARRDAILSGTYLLVLVIALLAGRALANQIARPVGRLTRAARRVAEGDLEVRLETDRKDELGRLESAFQSMTADLKASQERTVKVERELAWREMAKQVAHEIKNPLTPMRLSVQHLVSAYRKGTGDFAAVLKTVSETVLEQIDALSRIASEFSSFARFPERRLGPCPVHDVLEEAMALHRRDGVRFAASFAPGSPVVTADRDELRRAFINIFRNSLQAAAGPVTVRVETAVETAGDDAGRKVLALTIADDGPGMTPEIMSRLFEPNFSTKTGGMGIGLTLVRTTVEDLGGSVSVDSKSGSGTTVSIRLPIAGVDG